MGLTGEVSEVLGDAGELGKTGKVMGEISELGKASEMTGEVKGHDGSDRVRLDVSSDATPRLMAALCRAQTVVLEHIVAAAGLDLKGSEAMSLLGIGSVQAAEDVLQH
ncbi:hypothetical protein D4764_11G0003060 [Takifugu flavidus]|uniref:Uncharacterized protein n=1 Tax=Takifugu flavidus TaxID=433684 RepID=A0A5C6PFN6_9TELE|nr:hypothetical protein D4764_11G0003060 [Takifugu flavidus]